MLPSQGHALVDRSLHRGSRPHLGSGIRAAGSLLKVFGPEMGAQGAFNLDDLGRLVSDTLWIAELSDFCSWMSLEFLDRIFYVDVAPRV